MRILGDSLGARLLALLPTLSVFAVLAVLAVVGPLTHWKLSNVAKLWQGGGEPAESGDTGEPADKKETTPGDEVRFKSAEQIAKNGIKTEPAMPRRMYQVMTANGTIDYDRTRLVHLAPRAPGIVWKVYQQVGAQVHKGDLLALVDAAEVGRAKAEFLQAARALELKTKTLQSQEKAPAAVPDLQLRESRNAVAEARIRLFTAQQALANLGLPLHAEEVAGLSDEQFAQHLRFLGLPAAVTRTLDPETATANLLPLVAPFEGVVTRNDLVEGLVVASSEPRVTMADVRRMWVLLDLRQEDAHWVRLGQPVTFRPDGVPGVEAGGVVSWISTEVDDRTRTVRVRAEVANGAGQLRARSFGTGEVVVAEKPNALTVPVAALQRDGSEHLSKHLVFVRQGDGLSFERRTVELGLRNHEFAEILNGVRPGEMVATAGSHVLRSELFKGENGGD
jgi:cobalt-zinc-cadmium efflux system membrane fusion protein